MLTDKDIGRATAVPSGGGEKKEGEEDESGLSDEQAGSAVEVVGWQTRDSAEGDGLELYGTLRNNGGAIASSIELVVDVRDGEGKSLLETTAFLDSQTLVPGKATAFRALLPGLTSINGEPRFKVKSNEVTLAPAKPLPEGSEAEGELPEPGSG
ncbi:MAG: hypothetical protein HC897_00390 [Thermoanaerobaculia bacterium]|nr:hypothetical protein [Thermoanaerobaculia bacterium]